MDYYERTWICTPGTPPIFSPWMWNHHESVLAQLPRSSNIAEGWHNGFSSIVNRPNPTIWHFLDCLKLEQGLTEWKMVKRLMKEPPKPREKKWVDYDNRLAAIIESYEDHEDKLDSLKIVGSMMSV